MNDSAQARTVRDDDSAMVGDAAVTTPFLLRAPLRSLHTQGCRARLPAGGTATLAARVAANLGMPAPTKATVAPVKPTKPTVDKSPLLSQVNLLPPDIASRKVAILVADGVDEKAVAEIGRAHV